MRGAIAQMCWPAARRQYVVIGSAVRRQGARCAPGLRPVEGWAHGHDETAAGGRGRDQRVPDEGWAAVPLKYPGLEEDGTKRVVLKRGFTTRREAAAALRAE